MNNKVIVRLMEDELMYEEKTRILTENICKTIFPISILHRDNLITGYYNTSGYKKLSSCNQLTAAILLEIIEKIILAIEECCQYLIFPEEYVINTNTIYVDERYETIKITYIADKNYENVKNKFHRLLNSMKELTTEDGRTYLDMLMEISSVENVSYRKLRLLVSNLSQEAKKYCLS